MQVPNRFASIDDYRYGFQGQEKDDEIKGEGNSLNYTFRMHDPRVGRFFAVDPLHKSYPYYSPYQFSGNRVIDMIELEGLEPAENGSKEGECQQAFDHKTVDSGDYGLSDLFFGDKLYGDWFFHMGSASTNSGWYKRDDYRNAIMPFALDVAQSEGWSVGLTWQTASLSPGNPSDVITMDTHSFLTGRVFDNSDDSFFSAGTWETLLRVGRNAIYSHNKSLHDKVSGLTEPMGFDDPLFGVGVGYKVFFTQPKAIKFSSLSETGFIDPFQIRFSQNSIGANFKNGNSVLDVTKIDNSIPAIRIVEKDGLIYTLDNRRLRLFQEANIPIEYKKLESIPKKELKKFTTENQGMSIDIRPVKQ